MDPPAPAPAPAPAPPQTTTTTVGPPHSHSHSHTNSLPPLPTPKIRLMCSYGGHIVPRPQTKSLCYAGGETRIVAVDRRNTASTISSLTHHLSRTLYGNRPFTLKYQLPNEDLDSLISITTDEDLQNMLEEHDRIASSSASSRIRLFLFPTRAESVGSLLLDAKTESWFSDALNSTMIINRGLSDGSGMCDGLMGLDCLEGNGESLMSSGDSGKCGGSGGDSGSVHESMVLETCSSFGSINSSTSASNLTAVGVNNEENGGNLMEKKVKSATAGSIESHNSAASAFRDQNQVLPESESIICNPSSMIQMQPLQYVHNGPLPISSYYPMYIPYQQQPNQTYPMYVMPMGPTDQSYSMFAPADINETITGSLSRPPFHTLIPVSDIAVTPQFTSSNHAPNPPYENEYDNDLACAQIYKSQPSAPMFENAKRVELVPLADSLMQMQLGTSQQ